MNKTQRMKAAIAEAKVQAEAETVKTLPLLVSPETKTKILANIDNFVALNEAATAAKPAKKHWGDQRLPMEKAGDDKRLPDGSEFWASYDAATKRWKGTLAFGPVAERILLTDDSGAVMKLLKKLDAQYRAWLKLNEVMPL